MAVSYTHLTRNNEVDIGVRVEVPNAVMDHLTTHLYEAKMVYYSDTFENKVRTFCMNPGGIVSEEHYEGGIAVVNGHSYAEVERRTGNTNFAMLVSSRFTEPFDQMCIRDSSYRAGTQSGRPSARCRAWPSCNRPLGNRSPRR